MNPRSPVAGAAELMGCAFTVGVSYIVFVGGVILANVVVREVRVGWRKLRVWMLGGVSILEQTLNIDCAMCQERMEAGTVVRTLSCDHVFHKACGQSIDVWLRENDMACPVCRQTARTRRVLPWRAPPPPTPGPSPPIRSGIPSEETDLEGQARLPLSPRSEEQNLLPPPPQPLRSSSSTRAGLLPEETDLEGQDQTPPPPASSSSAGTSGLEEPLLQPSASP